MRRDKAEIVAKRLHELRKKMQKDGDQLMLDLETERSENAGAR
jgi:hypothetical protein